MHKKLEVNLTKIRGIVNGQQKLHSEILRAIYIMAIYIMVKVSYNWPAETKGPLASEMNHGVTFLSNQTL